MPVKFWLTIVRFWFFLSYLIPTVSDKNVTYFSLVLKELALFMLEFNFINNFDPLYSVVQKQMTRAIDTGCIIMPTAVIDQTGATRIWLLGKWP